MKIYVTGASGFIGQRLVRQLVTTGHDVVALGRDPARLPAGEHIEPRTCDLLQLDTILPAIEDCDAGIHLAGVGPHAPAKAQQQLNVQASRHLAAAAKRKKSLNRLVAITSAAVEEPGDSLYRQYKTGQEAALRSHQLQLTLLRPTLVLGPWQESRELSALVARLRQGNHYIPNAGRTRVQPVDVRDVVQAAIAALTREDSVGAAVVVAGPEPGLPFRELLGAIRARTAGQARLVGVPIAPMRIAAALGAVVGKAASWRARIAYYTHDHVYPLEPAGRLLGFQPTPYPETFAWAFGGA